MRTAVLLGREHETLGGVSAISEGRSAIALSRGGASKRYPHKHPNEDAALFAESPWGTALAVADGHAGCEGSEAVLERFASTQVGEWTALPAKLDADRWADAIHAALLDWNDAILERVARGEAEGARTTLALAVIRPADDLLAYASMGDSHVFQVRGDGVIDLAPRGGTPHFLGNLAEDHESLKGRYAAGVTTLAGTRAVVLATDGLSERGIGVADPAQACAEVVTLAARAKPDLRALETARSLAEYALESHRAHRAGDNVATAVVWID